MMANSSLLNAHLESLEAAADLTLPPDWDGVIGFDWEGWEPVWDQYVVFLSSCTFGGSRFGSRCDGGACKLQSQPTITAIIPLGWLSVSTSRWDWQPLLLTDDVTDADIGNPYY
jgi:hypothetical protein